MHGQQLGYLVVDMLNDKVLKFLDFIMFDDSNSRTDRWSNVINNYWIFVNNQKDLDTVTEIIKKYLVNEWVLDSLHVNNKASECRCKITIGYSDGDIKQIFIIRKQPIFIEKICGSTSDASLVLGDFSKKDLMMINTRCVGRRLFK